MKIIRLSATLVLSALLAPVALPALVPAYSVARADDAATPAQTQVLKDLYAKRNASLKDRDFDAVIGYESDDYVEFDSKGKKRDKDEADSHFKEQVAQLPPIDSLETTVDSLTVSANGDLVAVTTTTVEISLPGQDGGAHKLLIVSKSNDIWVANKDAKDDAPTMLVKQSTEVKTTVTMDGQPIDAETP